MKIRKYFNYFLFLFILISISCAGSSDVDSNKQEKSDNLENVNKDTALDLENANQDNQANNLTYQEPDTNSNSHNEENQNEENQNENITAPEDNANEGNREPQLGEAVLPDELNEPQTDLVLYGNDFESESDSCWSNRPYSGWNFNGCGQLINIGAGDTVKLVTNEVSHSGSKALKITYNVNEDYGGAEVDFPPSDHVFTRYYDYHAAGFDFAFGTKVHRIRSFNYATQINNFDMVSSAWGQSLNTNESDMSGTNDMRFISMNYGGGPFDWGGYFPNYSYQRQRWYCVETEVKLNDENVSNGEVRLWVDGVLVIEQLGLKIRLSNSHDINLVLFGGWYSNGAAGRNPQLNPNQTSIRYIDDVMVSTERIRCN